MKEKPMKEMPTATKVNPQFPPSLRGHVEFYKLSEPVEFSVANEEDGAFDDDPSSYGSKQPTNYVLVSTVRTCDDLWEVFVFPADSEGDVLSWSEIKGSHYRNKRWDYKTSEEALNRAGYVLA